MLKPFMPTICPNCGGKLSIEHGKSEDIIKLLCPNKECSGFAIKTLQKGITSLEIKGLGPAVIEKLYLVGIRSTLDLFNKEKFNTVNLIKSGEFKNGRALEKIIESVSSFKEVSIDKFILSLQLKDIGRSLSLEIGKMLSGVPFDFNGLNLEVRQDMNNKGNLYETIVESISKAEEFGIKIVRIEKKVQKTPTKTVVKKVHFLEVDGSEIIEKLGWEKVDINECDFLICSEKTTDSEKLAKENGAKLYTLKQIKLLFL
jgi:NAD-dependent DNA ligase